MVSRAGPDALGKMKIYCPCRESRDDSSILHSIVSSLTDHSVPADLNIFFKKIHYFTYGVLSSAFTACSSVGVAGLLLVYLRVILCGHTVVYILSLISAGSSLSAPLIVLC